MNPEVKVTTQENSFWKELSRLILISLVIVVPFRLYIAQPFIVDGASMDPTFQSGEYLIVDEVTYRFSEPKRGDVLIFKYPRDTKKFFIKRVIGLPGELVEIRDGKVTVSSIENPTGETLSEPYIKLTKEDNFRFSLGAEEYFVLGDNRIGSSDSRVWGPVPDKLVIGRPIIRFWPPAFLPGKVEYEHNNDITE